ncbi:MAG: CpsD/CapB family tyrosine-protein kinase [Desulfosporosinus sp.]|nr:CpsD/CapB family tyrosine-protein kinase [Desulfosporosinus sp.]
MQAKTFDMYDNKNQAVQEAYAMLTTNILMSDDQEMFKTIAMTSYNPEEGKTSLAISLAIMMAHSGGKVLLVDADMRKPTAAKRLNKSSLFGLSDYLAENIEFNDVLSETNITNLTYCSCGNEHRNPMGLLYSSRFEDLVHKLANDYDIVIFDTPALSSVVDGAIVASSVDATLLVVKMGFTTLASLKRIKNQLEKLNVNILGVILNRVQKHDYKKYFGSYNYFFNSKRFVENKKVPKANLPQGDRISL